MRFPVFVLFTATLGLCPLAAAQTAPARTQVPAVGHFAAIGCLTRQGTVAAPRYVVTDTRSEKPAVYRISGDAEWLARHVGHTVEVSGGLSPPAAAGGQYALKAESVAWLASTCTKK